MDVDTNMPVPEHRVSNAHPAPSGPTRAERLNARISEYRTLLSMHRRRRYLGLAAVLVALVWLALALLYYFGRSVPSALFWGLAATLILPLLALLIVQLRTPTELETARTLDALLDDRQRVVTAVELLGEPARVEGDRANGGPSPVIGAQLASTARMLDRVEPRVLYPARMPVGQLVIAGGLIVLALGMWLLKSASGDLGLAAGGLPPSKDTTQAVATATALAGLPDSTQNQPEQNTQPSALATAPSDSGSGNGSDQSQAGGTGSTGTNGTTSQLSPQEAQQQADASREAEKSLQRLAQALDGQGVTQGIADDIRKGDYKGAGDALSDLGANNDQLSQDAKDSLAQNLDAAADDSASTSELQEAERNAAQALRNGDFDKTKQALEDLGQAVEGTGNNVVPQQDLARNFPDQQNGTQQGDQSQGGQPGQTGDQSTQAQNQSGQQGQGQDQAQGAQGDQGQQGQQGSGGIPDPNADNNGASPENGSSSNSSGGTSTEGNQQGDQSSQGTGAGNTGLPGEGSKVEGPPGQSLDVTGNPFEIAGNDNPDPNGTRPGDPQNPSALIPDTGSGSSGSANSPSSGGPVDAQGESTAPPVGRWGIIQRYFSQDQK
ncbi:MAG TPA: hypothetical protein VLQ48_05025 [Chloroflexia bacterium]|nr:hypothetical protein [Chloroflexia bacterium]